VKKRSPKRAAAVIVYQCEIKETPTRGPSPSSASAPMQDSLACWPGLQRQDAVGAKSPTDAIASIDNRPRAGARRQNAWYGFRFFSARLCSKPSAWRSRSREGVINMAPRDGELGAKRFRGAGKNSGQRPSSSDCRAGVYIPLPFDISLVCRCLSALPIRILVGRRSRNIDRAGR